MFRNILFRNKKISKSVRYHSTSTSYSFEKTLRMVHIIPFTIITGFGTIGCFCEGFMQTFNEARSYSIILGVICGIIHGITWSFVGFIVLGFVGFFWPISIPLIVYSEYVTVPLKKKRREYRRS